MSNKISGKVWELDLDPVEKLVLLALADHADHEGNNVRPGNELLCAKTGLSERTIGKKIEKFVKAGILVTVRANPGPGKKREFSLVTDLIPRHEYFVLKEAKKVERASIVQRAKTVEPRSIVRRRTVEPGSGVSQLKTIEPDSTVGTRTVEPDSTERSNLAQRTVEPGAATVEPGAATVEPGDNSHDKERARDMNRHEPSMEPSEREESSPALSAIDEIAIALFSLYGITDDAGWRLKDKFQSLAMELHGVGATPDEVRSFYASRHKKPGVEFFAGDFVTWRASQNAGPAVGPRTAQRQQASAKAKEILFGGDKR